MSKNRLEAFSDGVMAIVITIIVLNINIPVEDSWHSLLGITDQLIIYMFSFSIVGVYWVNHHNLLKNVTVINSLTLWLNNIFLFTLTLLPISTNWIGGNLFSLAPQIVYGMTLLIINCSFFGLSRSLSHLHPDSLDAIWIRKSYITIIVNILAIIIGYWLSPIWVLLLNIAVIIIWLFPNNRNVN